MREKTSRRWKGLLIGSALALLIGLPVLVAGNGSNAAEPKHQYVGVAKCKNCHRKKGSGEAFQKWEQGPHAKAYATLGTDEAKSKAQKAGVTGDPQKAPECLKCHVTAYGVNAKWLFKSFKAEDGVQCESCHGPGKDYRKKKVMLEVEQAKAKGLILPKEETCTQCHNDKSPSWDPNKYTVDGKKVGFDFEQAKKKIEHPTPEEYKKKVREEKDEDEEDEE